MTQTEAAIAELGEQLWHLSSPAAIAKTAPNVAKLVTRRREELARSGHTPSVLTNSHIDAGTAS
jgi:hypothetical protein